MLARAEIDRVVSAALAEDAPWGDVTAEAFVPDIVRASDEEDRSTLRCWRSNTPAVT